MADFETALRKMWPNADQKISGLIRGMVWTAPAAFSAWGIGDHLLIQQHLMAQISHECGAGRSIVENLNYSAKRLTEVWPTRFRNLASAMFYAHNELALGDKVYNGRMGNVVGTHDGFNYRGRGGAQVTGRKGYQRLDDVVHLGLMDQPDLVNDPRHFLLCAVAEFSLNGCIPYASRDDVVAVSSMLNVGHLVDSERSIVGMKQRRDWLTRWKIEFTVAVPAVEAPPTV